MRGMSCSDYMLILIAGPCYDDLPNHVRRLMDIHDESCSCMKAPGYHQNCLSTEVTEAMKTSVLELIRDLYLQQSC